MTVLFMGGEMASFSPSDSQCFEKVQSGYYDSAFARCALGTTNGNTEYNESASWSSQADVWTRFDIRQNDNGVGYDAPVVTWYDGSTAVVRLYKTTTNNLLLQYLNASAVWTTADTEAINIRSLQTCDMHIDISGGALALYVAGTERLSGTGLSLGHITGITKLRQNANYYMSISQVVVSTIPTLGGRLFTVPISGAGATSQFTGTYLNIDEVQYSDADFINSGTANQVSTFAVTSSALDGYVVQAVGVYARARRGAGGPQNLQLALRSGGTNYFSSSQSLGLGYEPHGYIWETDPATSSAWVNANATTLQPGVKSIA